MKPWSLAVAAILLLSSSCGGSQEPFVILSGSENQPLEQLVQEFAGSQGTTVKFVYKGSVDIMLDLQKPTVDFDAVWPASGLWITLGDEGHRVKHAETILTTPVVFGVKTSLAQKFGWVGQPVQVADILARSRSGDLKFLMTSASQSNSGASAYFGFLYALLGNPDVLTLESLQTPGLKEKLRTLLSGISRSSGSSGWLKDLFVSGNYDAMVNYESLVIEANQALVAQNREPLYAVYPQDGLVIADSQLGWVDRGTPPSDGKEAFFLKLKSFLLSDATQAHLLDLGRRTGLGGFNHQPSAQVFNPDWGIDPNRILSPIKIPAPEVVRRALNLYQTDFRKPSLTFFCLDYSGSMDGERNQKLVAAMDLLLDPEQAKNYLLQPSSDDVTVVIPFSGAPLDEWRVTGNDPGMLTSLADKIHGLAPDGSTDIYSPLIRALSEVTPSDLVRYVPAVILMSDGESNTGKTYEDVDDAWTKSGLDVPVFPILFGDASEEQMKGLAARTQGLVFDGRSDLVSAFKKAKGYN